MSKIILPSSAHETDSQVLPFLKWAGGKRWLTTYYSYLLPTEFGTYFEPFLGSGAVFFHLRPQKAFLGDANPELINTYIELKKNWKKVRSALARHQKLHDANYYYEERERKRIAPHERAAQFIYLNRTCWNGLYRVNLEGKFNVPIGTKQSVILATDDFEQTSKTLSKATLAVSDFSDIIENAKRGDFIFIDPPYVTSHNLNGFLKYNDKIFSWSDQERLSLAIRKAAKRGVKMLVTNAAHESIYELYKGIGKHLLLSRSSVLAADSDNRGKTEESALLVNYDVQTIDSKVKKTSYNQRSFTRFERPLGRSNH